MSARAHRAHRAWLALGSVAAVLGLGFGTLWTVGLIAEETRTVVREFDPAAVDTLTVDTDTGDVVVIGDLDEGEAIVVTMRITEGLFGVSQRTEVRDGRLDVAVGCPHLWTVHCGVDIEVHVPPDVRVVVHTDNGRGRVRDVGGGVDLSSDNGDLLAERIEGRISFDTDNGDVIGTGLVGADATSRTDNGDVTLFFADPPRQASAASDNGNIELRLPRGDEAYALTAETDNGQVSSPVRTDPASERRLAATSDNGDIAVRYAD